MWKFYSLSNDKYTFSVEYKVQIYWCPIYSSFAFFVIIQDVYLVILYLLSERANGSFEFAVTICFSMVNEHIVYVCKKQNK